MSNAIPLPPLPFGWWKDKVTESEMEHFIHAHAAAVSAELDAEIAGLRKALAAAIRQNEHDMLMTGEEFRAARAALGDKTCSD